MSFVYLLTGSNLGNREGNLRKAKSMIEARIGNILALSAVYETEPWGFTEETNAFFNQAMKVSTLLSPIELLDELLNIERELGRERKMHKYEPREIDIDILFYDDQLIETKRLIIPHPKMHLRRFTLAILQEIEPDFIHPALKKDISTLLKECGDESWVRRCAYERGSESEREGR
jgi:2-amino-4-hydroxy-6-hydroxymethyldihydropteridine diphosphokinase